QEHGQRVAQRSFAESRFIPNDQQVGERPDQAGGGRNGETDKFPATATGTRQRSQAVEPRQAKGAADDIDRSNEPPELRIFYEYVPQHDSMNQEGRRHAKGNQVGQGIEFPSERALPSAHSRDPSVKKV